jgi:AraC-like DNA-binding protein
MREAGATARLTAKPGTTDVGSPSTGMVRVGPSMALPALLREHSVDPVALLAEFGLDPACYDDPDNKIPFATSCRLVARCAEVTRVPHFGLLVGQRARLSSLGPVGLLAQHSPDVGTALEAITSGFCLHNSGAAVDLVVGNDSFARLRFMILEPGIEDCGPMLQEAMAYAVNILRFLCGAAWRASEVRFAQARAPEVAPLQRFFRTRLVFDASETSVAFHDEWLGRRIHGADPLIHSMTRRQVSDMQSLLGEDLVSQLRRMLPALIAARNAVPTVAAQRVKVTVRTLNRRLATHGTSFRRLREEACYAITCQLLKATDMPAQEIARHLGYANASAFTRAFQRWSGKGPARWRASCGRQYRQRSGT